MLVTCILTSYNRPQWVRHALKSVADQTHRDFELLVFDDSSALQIHDIVAEFFFPSVRVFHTDVPPNERRSTNRLSINCNRGLAESTGDLITYLCDDDYYYPGWFESAVKFFSAKENASKTVGYGILSYSGDREMKFPDTGHRLYPGIVTSAPACKVDHNQVIHRRFTPPFKWPEAGNLGSPDAAYFQTIAKAGNPFHPIGSHAVVKRNHKRNLQKTISQLGTPEGEGLRE